MFAGGVGRIFREFDEFLDITYVKRATGIEAAIWKKKNRKKLTNLLENFLEETACLLNIDRSDFANGELPWGLIFYNRMLSTKNLVNVERHALYQESFGDYAEFHKDSKPKEIKKKIAFINSVNSLVNFLKTHSVDPDNVLIGLTPSVSIIERYEEWLKLPEDHKNQAKKLSEKEGNSDPLALYFVGYPAKKGDIVIAQVPLDKVTTVDLRIKAIENQERKSVIQFARIKEAVEFNKKTFLTIWIAPKEEKEITVPAEDCVPMRKLVPGQAWIGNISQMRDMVADPYEEFISGLNAELIYILNNLLEEKLQIPIQKVYFAIQKQPVSFLYYHHVKSIFPIINSLVLNEKNSNFKGLDKIHEKFFSDGLKTTKNELEKLINIINDPDGTTNKLFMPTSDVDLKKLHSIDPKFIVNDFLKNFQSFLSSANSAFESEKRELMKGNLKNQISKWWLLLIKTRSELILAQTKYDPHAWNEDTYIDEPPSNLELVRENLIVVQDILNPKHDSHKIVIHATEDIKNEVYPVIDDFIMKAHIVLSHDLLDKKIYLDYSPEKFNLDEVRNAFNTKKSSLSNDDSSDEQIEYFKQLDDLMKDLKYLVEMKNLEYKTANSSTSSTTGGKLELSYAVPLSGLVMGSFFRLENILKTVLELWAPKDMLSSINNNQQQQQQQQQQQLSAPATPLKAKTPPLTPKSPRSPKSSPKTNSKDDTFLEIKSDTLSTNKSAPSSARDKKRLSRRVSVAAISTGDTPIKRKKRKRQAADDTETPRRRKRRDNAENDDDGDGEKKKKKSKRTKLNPDGSTAPNSEVKRRKKKQKDTDESSVRRVSAPVLSQKVDDQDTKKKDETLNSSADKQIGMDFVYATST